MSLEEYVVRCVEVSIQRKAYYIDALSPKDAIERLKYGGAKTSVNEGYVVPRQRYECIAKKNEIIHRDDLAPCAFCGTVPYIKDTYVYCPGCHTQSFAHYGMTQDDLVNQWNNEVRQGHLFRLDREKKEVKNEDDKGIPVRREKCSGCGCEFAIVIPFPGFQIEHLSCPQCGTRIEREENGTGN